MMVDEREKHTVCSFKYCMHSNMSTRACMPISWLNCCPDNGSVKHLRNRCATYIEKKAHIRHIRHITYRIIGLACMSLSTTLVVNMKLNEYTQSILSRSLSIGHLNISQTISGTFKMDNNFILNMNIDNRFKWLDKSAVDWCWEPFFFYW